MKKLVAITAAMAVLVGAAFGQEYKSRLPTPTEQNRIAGVSKYIQDVYLQLTTPKVLMSGPYYATNYNDGVLFPYASSVATTIGVVLPNPTNNVGRKYEIVTAGQAISWVTNNNAGWKIWDLHGNVAGNGFAIASNKVAFVYSTGTNWAAYLK
jgi:hypothetical protein